MGNIAIGFRNCRANELIQLGFETASFQTLYCSALKPRAAKITAAE